MLPAPFYSEVPFDLGDEAVWVWANLQPSHQIHYPENSEHIYLHWVTFLARSAQLRLNDVIRKTSKWWPSFK